MTHDEYLGGRDIPAILGLVRNTSPLQVALRHKKALKGEDVPTEPTPDMVRGLSLEPWVARRVAAELGPLRKAERLIHPEYSFLGATPDYFTVDRKAIVEIKTHAFPVLEPMPDEVVQVAWQQHIARKVGLEVDIAYVAEAAVTHDATVVRDPETGASFPVGLIGVVLHRLLEQVDTDAIERIAVRWWERYVLGDDIPEPTAVDVETMNRIYPRANLGPIEADEEAQALVREIMHLRAQSRRINEQLDTRLARLKGKIGEHCSLILPNGAIHWKSHERVVRKLDPRKIETLGLTEDDVTTEQRQIVRPLRFSIPEEAEDE